MRRDLRYPEAVRPRFAVAFATLLSACAPSPAPVQPKATPDITVERWYTTATQELAATCRDGERFFQAGRFDQVAAAIAKGQPLEARLLEATRPTLAAMEAA